jgi:hypothetical protein
VNSAHPLPVRSLAHSFAARRSSRSVAWLPLRVLAVASALYGLGCSDTLDPLDEGGEGGDADFGSIYAELGPSCSECHAPGAPGRTEGIEATQDWSTAASARRTLDGNATGLIGNFSGCNGVPLLGASAGQSLLVASLDDDVRANFELADHPDCTGDAISNQNLKLSEPVSDSVLQDLKDWIDAGAP